MIETWNGVPSKQSPNTVGKSPYIILASAVVILITFAGEKCMFTCLFGLTWQPGKWEKYPIALPSGKLYAQLMKSVAFFLPLHMTHPWRLRQPPILVLPSMENALAQITA